MPTPAGSDVLPLIREMVALETALASLYQACAARFPEDGEFWTSVRHEEEGHAMILESLATLIAAHPARFRTGRPFRPAAIRTVIAGVERVTSQVRSGAVGRRKALVVARDFETSLLESRYGDVVSTDDVEYRKAVSQIDGDTQRHRDRFQELLDRWS